MLKGKRRRIIAVLAAFGLVVGLLTLALVAKPLMTLAVQEGIRFARSKELRISIGRTEGSFSHVQLSDVELNNTFRVGSVTVPVTFKFDELSVRPSYSTLAFGRRAAGTLEGKAYGGEVSSTFDAGGNTLKARASLAHLHLADHPQLAGSGITGGEISIDMPDLKIDEGRLQEFNATFTVANVIIPQFPKLAFPIKFPPLTDGNASVALALNSETITLSDVKINSSWAAISGSVTGTRPDSTRIPTASGKFTFELKDSFSQVCGPYLPLLSGGKLAATSQNFSIEITGTACNKDSVPAGPKMQLGPLCIQHSFV